MPRPLFLLLLAPLAVVACSPEKTDSAGVTAPAVTTTVQEGPLTSVVSSPAPDETDSQRIAREKAERYLAFAPFSVDGLIKQLTGEGFSEDDAAYAVFVLNLDWDDQAVKRAAIYVERSPITRNDLIGQLVFDGFTLEQAEHGADVNGL